MIIELLQPGADPWEAAAVPLRAAGHATALGAAGLALFAAGFAHRLEPDLAARLRRWTLGAALAGIALSVLALLLRTGALTAGDALFDAATWRAMMASRIGDAALIRIAGLGLVALLATGWRAAPSIAAMGALMVAASHAAIGHSTLYHPRQALAALVTLHLLAIAFWLGSLPPLAWVAGRGGEGAARLVADWSRIALGAVAVALGSGLLAAWLLLRRWEGLTGAWYGWGLMAKLVLVLALLGLAAWHRLRLTPALAAGRAGAGARLRASILAEIALAVLVLHAAAEMVSVHPADFGHRIGG